MWVGNNVGCTMGFLLAHSAQQIDQFPTCWPMNGLFGHWSRGWGVLSFSERLVCILNGMHHHPLCSLLWLEIFIFTQINLTHFSLIILHIWPMASGRLNQHMIVGCKMNEWNGRLMGHVLERKLIGWWLALSQSEVYASNLVIIV